MGNTGRLNSALLELDRFGRVTKKRQSTSWLAESRLWSLIVLVVIAFVFVFVPAENRYPGALASAFVFLLVQWFLPACRPVSEKLLCPWNWALFVFFLQLVLLPLSVLLFGPSLGVLTLLPSDLAINLAMVINAAAFVAFCGTYHYVSHRAGIGQRFGKLQQNSRVAGRDLSLGYIALNGAIGIIGFFFAFRTFRNVEEYFVNPFEYLSRWASESDKLALAAGVFLRPFLGICLVILWCRWLDRKRNRKAKSLSSWATALPMCAVGLSNATFNYNRGSVLAPLVAMLAVILSGPSRVSRKTVASACAIILLALLFMPFYGAYRSSDFTGQELLTDPSTRDLLAGKIDLSEMFQVYGGAPQFLGFFLEASQWGAKPQWGKVFVSSLLAPLPILGKSFRESSGTAIYNSLIYGMPDVSDQVAPFQGEIFLDFNLAGVIAGFCFLGWVAFKLQTAFEQSRSSFETFIWQHFSIWTFFLIFGSVSVVSQIYIYFCWPTYLYFFYRRLKSRPAREVAHTSHEARPACS